MPQALRHNIGKKIATALLVAGALFISGATITAAYTPTVAHAADTTASSASLYQVYDTKTTDASGKAYTGDSSWGKWGSDLAMLIYYVTAYLGSWVAYIGAYLFAIAVSLSLNSAGYALQFISVAWTWTRDFANMFFIFILAYLAITVMLRAETQNTMKQLAWVIAMALLINFSFFIPRLVIDFGNILAVQFYNAVPTTGTSGATNLIAGVKDISVPIMNALAIQKIVNDPSSITNISNGSFWGTFFTLSFVYMVVGVALVLVGIMLIQVALQFIFRTITLWFVIIAAPLAFVAKTVKQFEDYFTQWWHALVMNAFFPAMFLFMYLIVASFSNAVATNSDTGVLSTLSSGAGSTSLSSGSTDATKASNQANTTSSAFIRLAFILIMLTIASQVSKRMSQKVGESSFGVFQAGEKLFGTNKFTSGRLAGLAYRNTAGRTAAATSQKLAYTKFGTSRFGQYAQKQLNTVAASSVGGVRSFTQTTLDDKKIKDQRAANQKKIQDRENLRKLSRAKPNSEEAKTLTKKINISEESVSGLGKSDIQGLVQHLNEDQMGKLIGSKVVQGYKETDRNGLKKAWEETSSHAPLMQTTATIEKALGRLNKIQGADISSVTSRFTKGGVINTSHINETLESVDHLMSEQNALKDTTKEKSARAKIYDNITHLAEARSELRAAGEKLKSVPALDSNNQHAGSLVLSEKQTFTPKNTPIPAKTTEGSSTPKPVAAGTVTVSEKAHIIDAGAGEKGSVASQSTHITDAIAA